MSSYPLLLDFLINLHNPEENPVDYWNYYPLNNEFPSTVDFSYRKLLKKQGYLTEIFKKDQFSTLLDDAGAFLSCTKEKLSFVKKSKKRKFHKRLAFIPAKKPKKRVFSDLSIKYIRKPDKYQRKPKEIITKPLIISVPNAEKPLENLTIQSVIPEKTLVIKRPKPTKAIRPTYENFIKHLRFHIPLNTEEEEQESMYYVKSLLDLQSQPLRKSLLETCKEIIKKLPRFPEEPAFLPVFHANSFAEIDYQLLKVKIHVDLTNIKEIHAKTQRKVVFLEENSLETLRNHFQIDMNKLENLFDRVSRFLPDLLEYFKGNCDVLWSEQEDSALRKKEFEGVKKEKERIMRRARFLNLNEIEISQLLL